MADEPANQQGPLPIGGGEAPGPIPRPPRSNEEPEPLDALQVPGLTDPDDTKGG